MLMSYNKRSDSYIEAYRRGLCANLYLVMSDRVLDK